MIISSGNLNGWSFGLESGASGSFAFVPGTGALPAGIGSANFIVGDSATGVALGAQLFGGIRLDELSTLNYQTWMTSVPGSQVV